MAHFYPAMCSITLLPTEVMADHVLPAFTFESFVRLCASCHALWSRRKALVHALELSPECVDDYTRLRALHSIPRVGTAFASHLGHRLPRAGGRRWPVTWRDGSCSLIAPNGRVTRIGTDDFSVSTSKCYNNVVHVAQYGDFVVVATQRRVFVHTKHVNFRGDEIDEDFDDMSMVISNAPVLDFVIRSPNRLLLRMLHGEFYVDAVREGDHWHHASQVPTVMPRPAWELPLGTSYIAWSTSRRPTVYALCGCKLVSLRARVQNAWSLLGDEVAVLLMSSGGGVLVHAGWSIETFTLPGFPAGAAAYIGCTTEQYAYISVPDVAVYAVDLLHGGKATRHAPYVLPNNIINTGRMCVADWPLVTGDMVTRHW